MKRLNVFKPILLAILLTTGISCRQTGHSEGRETNPSGESSPQTDPSGIDDDRLHNSPEGNPDTDTSAHNQDSAHYVKEKTPPEVSKPGSRN